MSPAPKAPPVAVAHLLLLLEEQLLLQGRPRGLGPGARAWHCHSAILNQSGAIVVTTGDDTIYEVPNV